MKPMSSSKSAVALVVVAVASAFAIAGCGSNKDSNASSGRSGAAQSSASNSAPVSMIDAKLTEWSIDTNAPVAKAGKVDFTAVNDGAAPHELIVLKTDTPAADLPVKDGRVSEKDSVGEISELEAGKSGANSLDLAAGKYVLVCNISGHYSQGMYKELTVK